MLSNSGRAETETERCISEMLPDHYFLNVLVLVANRIADEGLRMAEEREVKDGEEEILSRSPSSFDGPGVVVVVYDGCIT